MIFFSLQNKIVKLQRQCGKKGKNKKNMNKLIKDDVDIDIKK